MPDWVPLHLHDHNSLLDGLQKPKQIVARLQKLGYKGCALTNHGNISGAVSFIEAMEKAKLKWVLGNEFYIAAQDSNLKDKSNRRLSHLPVLAKNKDGWAALIKATSASNHKDNFYYKPRLNLDRLSSICKDKVICFSGHPGSDMANILFTDMKAAYKQTNISDIKMCLHNDWETKAIKVAEKYQELFGIDNFYIEIQVMDAVPNPINLVIAECLRKVAKHMNIKCVATCDAHYSEREDAPDQRVLLATSLQTTLSNIKNKMDDNEEFGLSGFFKSNNFHITSLQDLSLNTEDELRTSIDILDKCETYKITGRPQLPQFVCPNGQPGNDYLRQLCRNGWRTIVDDIPTNKYDEYVNRVKHELDVINGANLSGYFLIVQDIIQYCKSEGWLTGPGRGSVGGSMVAYLLGITKVDPIKYDLMFERFYNAGRNTADKVSLPDIDCDFPITKREPIKQYIKTKYGEDKVCEISTFQRMQGRGALKDVLRAHEACTYDQMNRITEGIPEESKIADDLQEMKEIFGDSSIIKWTLQNNGDKLKEWCEIDAAGHLSGPMAKLFAQAIRMEGTYRGISKHAAGVIISPFTLSDHCPMIYDKKTDSYIAGFEYEDLEKLGFTKLDILGVATLEKISAICQLISTGKIQRGNL